MPLRIVIAVHPPEEGKSRLASVLCDAERYDLNLRLYRQTLRACMAVVAPERCHVVSRSPALLREAAQAGMSAHPEEGRDLNLALTQGAMAARANGATSVLSVSTDLPLLQPADLEAMIAAGEASAVVIAPDRSGLGTNALLVRPPLAIPYRHGIDSCRHHVLAAQSIGVEPLLIQRPGLAADLDLPTDLRAFDEAR
ncbi:2-phospho-L-lactate guanylyltransferase [Novosphingobium sp. BL-52-GroH]|uniref:2-phospho-L-lactate guanylyltransferase n=1 Tax=Novosphingobium sp. BL-52-GroH TaxID=3349877 RepID=UPI00384D66F1